MKATDKALSILGLLGLIALLTALALLIYDLSDIVKGSWVGSISVHAESIMSRICL